MIFSISGRKGSGKSTLCNELIQRDFIKISFADALKEYCSKLYDFPLEWTYSQEEKEKIREIPYVWDEEKCNELSKLINEEIKFRENEEFKTIRFMLQYIGTEVLRYHDEDFHVKKTLERIDPNKNYCMDDTRFLNEKKYLESQNAVMIFVIRPNNFEYSNHQSETELNWSMFDYVIINDGTEKKLKKRFGRFVDTFFKKRKNYGLNIERNELISLLEQNEYNIEKVSEKIGCKRDKLVWWCEKLLININLRNEYKINHKLFLEKNEIASYFGGLLASDGCLKGSGKSKRRYVIELTSIDECLVNDFKKFSECDKPVYHRFHEINGKSRFSYTLNSPFIVENLKLWNIKPRKSTKEEIPDFIKDDENLFRYWLVGMIDGDGSIYIAKNKHKNSVYKVLTIKFLSSKQVIDFIKENFEHIDCYMHQEKKIDNLYSLAFHGSNAIKLYNEIYRGIGLARKWNRVEEYLKMKENHV